MISFQRILGREDEFCALLEASALHGVHAVEALKRLLASTEKSPLLHEFAAARSSDKKVTEEITLRLITTFVTPMEREDIESLAEALYKIPKTVEKFAERFLIVRDQLQGVDFGAQVRIMDQVIRLVLEMVQALRAGRNLGDINRGEGKRRRSWGP